MKWKIKKQPKRENLILKAFLSKKRKHEYQTKSYQVHVGFGFKTYIILLIHRSKDVCNNTQGSSNSLKKKWKVIVFLPMYFEFYCSQQSRFWVEHPRKKKTKPKTNLTNKIKREALLRNSEMTLDRVFLISACRKCSLVDIGNSWKHF